MRYLEEVIISGRSFGVLTNVARVPDILIAGPIGARDLCLFPASSANVQAYQTLTGQAPEIVAISSGDFIVNAAQGGGAAQYIIEQLPYYTPDECAIGLFSIVGQNAALPGMIAHLEALKVQYYILHCPDMPCPKYLGVVFTSGQRYWSPRLSCHDPMTLFHPDLMPSEFKNAGIVVVATLPLPNAFAFSVACKGLLIGQIFENYILSDHRRHLIDLVDRVWPKRCVLLNVNEREMALLGESLTHRPSSSSRNLAEQLEMALDSLLRALPGTAIMVGLGAQGMHVGCRLESERCRYYFPAISCQWSFSVGAGDTALASALGAILQCLIKRGFSPRESMLAMSAFSMDDWLAVARSFVEGGFVGNSIVDAYSPLEIREELIRLAKSGVEGLDLKEDHSFSKVDRLQSTTAFEVKTMLRERAVDEELEEVLCDTLGHI